MWYKYNLSQSLICNFQLMDAIRCLRRTRKFQAVKSFRAGMDEKYCEENRSLSTFFNKEDYYE